MISTFFFYINSRDMNKSKLPWRKPLETNNINDYHLVTNASTKDFIFYYSFLFLFQGSYNI
jgi:hypothetical protein